MNISPLRPNSLELEKYMILITIMNNVAFESKIETLKRDHSLHFAK